MAQNVTLISRVKSFVTNQSKAGTAGLCMVRDTLDHMEKHNDWTPLAWLIAKSDMKDARIYRAIVGAVTKGVSMTATTTEAKEQPSGLHIKRTKDWAFTNKWAMLHELCDKGLSFRSKDVQELLLSKERDDTFTLAKAAAAYKRFLQKIEDGHLTLDQVLKAIAADAKVNADLASPTVIEKPQPIKAA